MSHSLLINFFKERKRNTDMQSHEENGCIHETFYFYCCFDNCGLIRLFSHNVHVPKATLCINLSTSAAFLQSGIN